MAYMSFTFESLVKFYSCYGGLLTFDEKYIIPIPIGIKATPMTKKVGKTVPAVNIGCHAGSLCCLNALSKE